MKIVTSNAKYSVKTKRDKCDLNVVVKKKNFILYKTVFVDDVESIYTTNVTYDMGFHIDEDSPDYYRNMFHLAVTIYEKSEHRTKDLIDTVCSPD